MAKALFSGNEAIARGAYEGGCLVACAYPGTPSTEILENISKYPEIYCEWSTNEKVALDVAMGASFAGARALVAMKHVGLNVAADPLFSAAYIGTTGGLIIVTADDPSMHSSQNEQDNRNYARAAKLLMLEPSDSQEAKEFVKIGFDLSEKFDLPVLLRITTRIAHSRSIVELNEREAHPPTGYIKDMPKRNLLPVNARRRRLYLEERLRKVEEFANVFEYNRIERGDTEIGIIASGVAYMYAKEVLPEATFLKLSLTWPLPRQLIREFANMVKKIYVIEECDPFLETEIRAMGINVIGKELLPNIGELNPTILREAFNRDKKEYVMFDDLPPRPPVLCPGCPHRGFFYMVHKLNLYATGDIGCYTLGAFPPLDAMDTCVCMGASIGNALGMEKAIPELARKTVAVIGDSTFLHTGVPELMDVVYNKGKTTVVVLDNRTTAMTGHQDHPGTGRTLMGEQTKSIMPEDIARAMGIDDIHVVDAYDLDAIKSALQKATSYDGPSLIVVRAPCIFLAPRKPPYEVDTSKCIGCRLCLELGCPAIVPTDDKVRIDTLLCYGCDLCRQVCKVGAIKPSSSD